MDIIYCINCNRKFVLTELKEGMNVLCECGCLQRCLHVDDNKNSKWRVLNPFSFKDLRHNI